MRTSLGGQNGDAVQLAVRRNLDKSFCVVAMVKLSARHDRIDKSRRSLQFSIVRTACCSLLRD